MIVPFWAYLPLHLPPQDSEHRTDGARRERTSRHGRRRQGFPQELKIPQGHSEVHRENQRRQRSSHRGHPIFMNFQELIHNFTISVISHLPLCFVYKSFTPLKSRGVVFLPRHLPS